MDSTQFSRWLLEGGQVVIPARFLNFLPRLNISPENLGYLLLGLARCQQKLETAELAQDRWVRWCLSQGWAQWEGNGPEKNITFAPLWNKLYEAWREQEGPQTPSPRPKAGDFDYSKILKWLDQVRGTLSVTLREKQVIQEMNLKYGWSTDFILIFLQLAFERGHNQVNGYEILAKRVYENGLDTLEELVTFMNELDWVHYKVAEVKKCIGQYGGVTKPQREMYLKWSRAWNFGHELIMRAGEETIRTNNPSFKFIDAILRDWREKGVNSIAAAERVMAERDMTTRNVGQRQVNRAKRLGPVGKRDVEKLYGLDEQ